MSSSTSRPRTPFLVSFYDPVTAAPDAKARTLSSILAWSDRQLESCHDYIQVIFPLPESSAFSYVAPVVDKATFHAFQTSAALQGRLRDSLRRMLRFYGFELQEAADGWEVTQGANFSTASKNWVTRFDHNHLRITRIIRSLRVLGLEDEARAFFVALQEVYHTHKGRISQKSLMFWTRAAERPLYLAPEDDSDDGNGEDFLYEYEEKRAAQGSAGDLARDGESEGAHGREGSAATENGKASGSNEHL
ncbi:hypothetical protein MMC13_006076 [Lambiella insularis]|nr:hypothetical protein [Lambiella insularis]